MIVNCPSCQKKYKIDDNLIPAKGRLVQCSNCKEKWFAKSEINEAEILQINPQEINENNINPQEINENNINPQEINENNINEKEIKDEIINKPTDVVKKKKRKIGFISLLFAFLITFIGLFLFLDTFKYQISPKWKDFDLYINSVYEIFEYMLIIVKDLFNSY